jgi:hypothetical protein
MFSFFKKKENHKRHSDCVYINRQTADYALKQHYDNLTAGNRTVFVLCFFENTAERLSNTISNIAFAEKATRDIGLRMKIKNAQNPFFLFAEHHPHLTTEQTVINEIDLICEGNNLEINFFTSLDEPMMAPFNADNIIGLMKKLGMDEKEAISHNMVSKSIKNIQAKIAKRVSTSIQCKSQEEWMKLNYTN